LRLNLTLLKATIAKKDKKKKKDTFKMSKQVGA
jgi:hypothetical protein